MTVHEFVHTLAGRRIFFDRLHGNHGDQLIALAADWLLGAVERVDSPGQADWIVINGGGSMTERWGGLERLGRYNRDFPDIPLALWPSSFHFPETDLAELFRPRRSPAWLWAREQPSFDRLQKVAWPGEIRLLQDHDLAFALDAHPMLADLRQRPSQNFLLVVERDDWEGPTGRRRALVIPGLTRIPERWRSSMRRALLGPLRRRQDRSPFREAALDFLAGQHPGTVGMPARVGDVSLAETGSFEDFIATIADSCFTVTTRLHVAILGHLCKVPTYLVDGTYHKFQGVFDYSLQSSTVQLVTWNGQSLKLR